MSIFKVSIPISDYYGEEVYFQDYFFEGEESPTKEQVVKYLEKLAHFEETHPIDCMNSRASKECLESIENITSKEGWPRLYYNLWATNVRTTHPKWGDQPLSISKVNIVGLDTLDDI